MTTQWDSPAAVVCEQVPASVPTSSPWRSNSSPWNVNMSPTLGPASPRSMTANSVVTSFRRMVREESFAPDANDYPLPTKGRTATAAMVPTFRIRILPLERSQDRACRQSEGGATSPRDDLRVGGVR